MKFVRSGLAHKAVMAVLVAPDRHEGSKGEYLATWHVYSYVCLHDKPLPSPSSVFQLGLIDGSQFQAHALVASGNKGETVERENFRNRW